MSAFGISIASTEYDAAQALLDLQTNIIIRDPTHEQYDRQDSVETAKLFLSCVIASNVSKQPNKTKILPKVETKSPKYAVTTKKSDVATTSHKGKTPDQELTRDCHNHAHREEESSNKRSKIFKRQPIKHFTVTSGPVAGIVSKAAKKFANISETKNRVKTRDVETQTEDKDQLPKIEAMQFTISKLYEKMKSLQEQVKLNQQHTETTEQDISEDDKDFDDDDDDHKSYEVEPREMLQKMEDSDDSDSNMDDTFSDHQTPKRVIPKCEPGQFNGYTSNKTVKVLCKRNVNANADDLVPIGNGNVLIPSRIFRHINWNSYTSATRKLLTAVFSRRVLATHSLTGKPSPAFPNKPAKKKLDPAVVNDIVQTVVERCRVPENVVRTSITTKCADESKMFRTRENNKKKRKHKVNRENISPESDSDEF